MPLTYSLPSKLHITITSVYHKPRTSAGWCRYSPLPQPALTCGLTYEGLVMTTLTSPSYFTVEHKLRRPLSKIGSQAVFPECPSCIFATLRKAREISRWISQNTIKSLITTNWVSPRYE